mmetsp:Transcript_58514/g.161900  ORF Transcript_58514/g.161900 Transcript_58514/m.161900 type:complete len:211 (+) Transcript_58514:428-1060(+)
MSTAARDMTSRAPRKLWSAAQFSTYKAGGPSCSGPEGPPEKGSKASRRRDGKKTVSGFAFTIHSYKAYRRASNSCRHASTKMAMSKAVSDTLAANSATFTCVKAVTDAMLPGTFCSSSDPSSGRPGKTACDRSPKSENSSHANTDVSLASAVRTRSISGRSRCTRRKQKSVGRYLGSPPSASASVAVGDGVATDVVEVTVSWNKSEKAAS